MSKKHRKIVDIAGVCAGVGVIFITIGLTLINSLVAERIKDGLILTLFGGFIVIGAMVGIAHTIIDAVKGKDEKEEKDFKVLKKK